MTLTPMWRLTSVWVLLVAMTLMGFGAVGAGRWGFAMVILIATVKAQLIARQYMELRLASRPWRWTFDCLVGLSGAVIAGAHFLA